MWAVVLVGLRGEQAKECRSACVWGDVAWAPAAMADTSVRFTTVDDLYTNLSLKEVRRVLAQTERAAEAAREKLQTMVRERYPDLLRAADTVERMVKEQADCMNSIDHMLETIAVPDLPDFGFDRVREKMQEQYADARARKTTEHAMAMRIQRVTRRHAAIRHLDRLRQAQAQSEHERRTREAAAHVIWSTYQDFKRRVLADSERRARQTEERIAKLLDDWVEEREWAFDDKRWQACGRPVGEEDIGGVSLTFPCAVSPPLFVAMHTLATFRHANGPTPKVPFLPYLKRILGRTTDSLARYQLLFDMQYARIPETEWATVVDFLDPIDHTLIGGLVTKAVALASGRARLLIRFGEDSAAQKRKRAASKLLDSGEWDTDPLPRAPACIRFPVASLRQLPSRKKISTPVASNEHAGNNVRSGEPKSGSWWW